MNEVDRYINWPGQALAYKIGQLKIQELKDRAKSELGENFDIKDFHHEVLKRGALPLDILEQYIDQWIAQAK
jgi:prolyl oligopeptidase